MSMWTTPEAIRARIQRDWDSGKLLSAIVADEPLFPLRLPLRGPDPRELSEHFESVRDWIAGLQSEAKTQMRPGYRLAMREVNHRIIGANSIPDEIWIDTADDALAMITRQPEAERFKALWEQTRIRLPALLPWLTRRPLRALELKGEWTRLLDVTEWWQTHPKSGVYIRQMDLPGIHSKFIEQHRGVLSELFDLVLDAPVEESLASRPTNFARRYGFRNKPELIRFRILDESRTLLKTETDNDLSVTAETFARLELDIARVFITENEINFLAFPTVANSLAIFGAGYGFEALGMAAWLQNRTVHYWGDIDTHGFAILDSLRAHFRHVRSFLMDRETLLVHRSHWVDEPQPVLRDLERLDGAERTLFDDLRHNRFGDCVRLEQEKIGFLWLQKALQEIAGQSSQFPTS